jgi:hypothetical protein
MLRSFLPRPIVVVYTALKVLHLTVVHLPVVHAEVVL